MASLPRLVRPQTFPAVSGIAHGTYSPLAISSLSLCVEVGKLTLHMIAPSLLPHDPPTPLPRTLLRILPLPPPALCPLQLPQHPRGHPLPVLLARDTLMRGLATRTGPRSTNGTIHPWSPETGDIAPTASWRGAEDDAGDLSEGGSGQGPVVARKDGRRRQPTHIRVIQRPAAGGNRTGKIPRALLGLRREVRVQTVLTCQLLRVVARLCQRGEVPPREGREADAAREHLGHAARAGAPASCGGGELGGTCSARVALAPGREVREVCGWREGGQAVWRRARDA